MPNLLPPNWSWVKLGDVCKVKGGFAFKSKDYKKEGIPLVRISNIEDKKISLEDCVYIQPYDEEKVKEFLLHKGDILVALSGATTGKYGIYNLDQKAFLNQRIGRLHFNGSDKIIPSYVYLYLEIIRSEILKNAYGAAQPNISPTEIAEFPIPLPPLSEQKKIVEKIEELFSQLDSGVAALKKAKEQIRLYRQSVLAAAFSGRLNQDLSDYQINGIKEKNKSGKFLNPENLNPVNPTIPVNHGSDNLPNGWKWVKLGEVSLKITDGEHLRPKVQNSGIPFLSAKDVRENDVTFENVLYISEKDAKIFWKKCNPEKGDILIVSRGATVGRLCIIKTEKRFCLLGSVILVKVDKNINSSFIAYIIKSPQLNKKIINVSGSTAQQAIYLRDIKNVEIPLPPLSQQNKIVSEIEKRFSVADNLEKAIDESLAKAEALRQSILKKAFSGKLIIDIE